MGLVCREAGDIWLPEGHVSRSGKSIPGRGGKKEEKKRKGSVTIIRKTCIAN